jgi:hypothetical protein
MKTPSRSTGARDPSSIRLKIEPFGPTSERMAVVAQSVMKHKALQAHLAKTRNRLIGIDLIEPLEDAKPARAKPPEQFRAVIYDYTNNRALHATGRLAKPTALEITESAQQPLPDLFTFCTVDTNE